MSARGGFITSGRVLAAAIAACLVCAVLPVRFLGWTGAVSGVAVRLVAPVSDLGKWIGDRAARAETEEHPNPEIGRLQELESLVRAQEMRISELRAMLDALEQGDILPEARVRQLVGRVFSTSASRAEQTLLVRRGARDGVAEGAAAVVRGRHMLGVVSDVNESFCVVTPLVARNAGPIEVTVHPADGDGPGVPFVVSPTGDGTLRGPGQFRTEGAEQRPVEVRVGDEASLSDPAMAPHWGLLVGDVVEVERDPESPLRQLVTIRPRIDTRNVARVVLRVPDDDRASE